MKYWERILFIIILVLVTIAITFYVIVVKKQYKNKTFKSWQKYHKPLHKQFLSLFHKTKEVLDGNGVKWWAHDGTMLGTIRHRGFIPWDDDVDLAIYAGNKNEYDHFYDQIMTMFNGDVSFGTKDNDLTIEPYWFGFKIRSKSDPFESKELAVDLFVFFDEGNKLVGTLDNQTVFPKEWYYKAEVFPLTTETFEKTQVNVPQDPWAFLERVYTKNFYKEYRVQIPHTVHRATRWALDLAHYEEQTFQLDKKYQSLALKWKK